MTTKTIGEIVIVPVTVESATKRRRVTDGATEWGIRAFIPSLGMKDYSTPFIIPRDAAEIMAGDTVICKMRRGKLKAEKDGRYDTHFFWDCVEWNTQESPPSPVPSGGSGPSNSPQDDFRRSKEEMRWTEALGMATQAWQAIFANSPSAAWSQAAVEAAIMDKAIWYYQAIVAGPPQEMPPAGPTEAAEPPEVPTLVVALLSGTKCPVSGHGGMPLNLVQGDPRPKHPVYIYVQGIRSLDHWCYGEKV